jgi:dTDP-4-dehydrorhamnose 3,5-epimerase
MNERQLLSGLQLIKPTIYNDHRGYFYVTYQADYYRELQLPHFVQDNLSRSTKGVLRGLHYQKPNAQGKLVYVTRGSVWDVAVDLRKHSPTFTQWYAVTLSDENHWQLYIPPGFAHGFCVLSDTADFYYKCTDFYTPSAERGISWDDPTLAIPWPVKDPILANKDQHYPTLSTLSDDQLFD